MKKALITVPIIVILIAAVCTSFLLMNKKPVTSHINAAQKIAAYSKPAVVRIVNYAVIKWTFKNSYDYEVVDYLNKMQNQSIVGGSGSGATINSNGYIVTNAHVVEISKMQDQEIADMAFD
jgi:S1-C subfamily serine protease